MSTLRPSTRITQNQKDYKQRDLRLLVKRKRIKRKSVYIEKKTCLIPNLIKIIY